MEGGPSRSPSCMMGFGENSISNGLSSMVMMTSSNAQETNTLFLPLNNNNHNQNSSNSQRDSTTLMPQDSMNNNHNAGCYFMESNNNNHDSSISSSMKAKIMAHPHFPRLLAAYINCQKVGAPPEVVARLEEACGTEELAMSSSRSRSSCIGEDPALDQFMEAYCEMLTKYEQELTKPFKEAMLFFSRIECQFKSLTIASSDSACGNFIGRNGLPEEEVGASDNYVDPLAEDKELKGQLLRKYSGYLGSLKQDFLKKKKKGKLPKEARHQLLEWWSRHYKWPYPSESQKLALAESTGLDQKQINNWFINQRKRHWKPSEDMQFVVMDGTHPHYYMESVMGNPYPMDCTPSLI